MTKITTLLVTENLLSYVSTVFVVPDVSIKVFDFETENNA